MYRKLFAIALGFAVLAPAVASAHFTECTPGFWRNRAVTLQLYCDANGQPKDLPRCTDFLSIPDGGNPACCVTTVGNETGFAIDGFGVVTCAEFPFLLTPQSGEACENDQCPRKIVAAFLNSCFIQDLYNPCPEEY